MTIHNEQKYIIRPLKWKKNFSDFSQEYTAETLSGSYIVDRQREDCKNDSPWQKWKWSYCFDTKEYYDNGEQECKNALCGKACAEVNWKERLISVLAKK